MGARMRRRMIGLLALASVASAAPLGAQERIDAATVARIRDEGLNRSQVMEHMIWMSDILGPRLTGSPGF